MAATKSKDGPYKLPVFMIHLSLNRGNKCSKTYTSTKGSIRQTLCDYPFETQILFLGKTSLTLNPSLKTADQYRDSSCIELKCFVLIIYGRFHENESDEGDGVQKFCDSIQTESTATCLLIPVYAGDITISVKQS